MVWSYIVRRAAEHCPEVSLEGLHRRIGYASYVSLERRYLYYQVSKAGCTTIKWLLHEIEGLPPIKYLMGGQREARRDMFIHERRNIPIPSLLDLDDATQQHVLNSPDFMRFTIVRNPYTRLESAWRDKVQLCAPSYERYARAIKGRLPAGNQSGSLVSFDEFVAALAREDLANCDAHWRLQTVQTLRGALNLTHVGRLEDFSGIVSAFLAHVGHRALSGEKVMNRVPNSSHYDAPLAGRVFDLYGQDFAAFDYGRDSWVPASARAPQTVPESSFIDEVLERNLMINLLYDERDRLAHRVRALEEDLTQVRALNDALGLARDAVGDGIEQNRDSARALELALQSESNALLRAHYTFRLAERYRLCNAADKALATYLARTSLGQWDQEVAWSFYRAAQLKEQMNHPIDEVLETYARAVAARPDRAEALHGASRLCRTCGRFAEGFELARRGLAVARPSRALSPESWIYDYGLLDEFAVCAYWIGRHDECLRACETLLREGKLPERMRERVANNAELARTRLRATSPGQRITAPPPMH